jgi:hypothetical protein
LEKFPGFRSRTKQEPNKEVGKWHMRIVLMLIGALAQTDAENYTAERITIFTLRTERSRGEVGKSEDQRMNGEQTGSGLTNGVVAGGSLN